jgi:hypothetical protein
MTAAYQATVKPLDSLAKVSLRTNAEMASLVSQRAQACLALPAKLAAAQTPQDFVAAQMQFWQTAMTQYIAASRQITAAWSQLAGTAASLPQPSATSTGVPLMDAWLGAMTAPFLPGADQSSEPLAQSFMPQRDYIMVTEPKSPAVTVAAPDLTKRRAA